MRSTMTAVEKELENCGFLRIHKGFLVNLEHVKILKTENLELDNGDLYWFDARPMIGMLLETDLGDCALMQIFRYNAQRIFKL